MNAPELEHCLQENDLIRLMKQHGYEEQKNVRVLEYTKVLQTRKSPGTYWINLDQDTSHSVLSLIHRLISLLRLRPVKAYEGQRVMIHPINVRFKNDMENIET